MSIGTENGSQMTFGEWMPTACPEPIYGVSDSPARTSQSQENNSDLLAIAQASFSELCTFLDSSKKKRDPLSYSLRMLKICFQLMGDGISPDFSLQWTRTATMQNGQFSIPKTTEFPKTESGVSLSDILEDEVDESYFLSDHTTQRLLNYKDARIVTE